MGADLIAVVLETGKRTRPRFAKARKALQEKPDAELVKGLSEALQLDESEMAERFMEGTPPEHREDAARRRGILAEKARQYAQTGLRVLEEMWNGEWRIAVTRKLKNSQVLIFGDTSWGDPPFDEWDEVITALALGLHKAAGFW